MKAGSRKGRALTQAERVAQIVDALGLRSLAGLAELLDVSLARLSDIKAARRAPTANQAIELWKKKGVNPTFWLEGTGPLFASSVDEPLNSEMQALLNDTRLARLLGVLKEDPHLLEAFEAMLENEDLRALLLQAHELIESAPPEKKRRLLAKINLPRSGPDRAT